MSENVLGRFRMPAFPRPWGKDYSGHVARSVPAQDGMDLRDYFAAAYVTGRASRMDGIDDWVECSRNAYELADAMMTERTK